MASRLRVTLTARADVMRASKTRSHRAIAQSKTHCSLGSGCALRDDVLKALLIAHMVLIVTASADFVIPGDVVCQERNNNFSIAVNSSSSTFGVRTIESDWLTFGCEVTAASVSAEKQSRARLVKIEGLRLQKDERACSSQYETVQLLVRGRLTQLCSETPTLALLLRIDLPFTLQHKLTNNWRRAVEPYWVSIYDEAPATNVCGLDQNRASLQLKHNMYAFAASSLFKDAPTNDAACTLPEYTVALTADNPSTRWILIVLAAPPSISCWTLLLDGRRYSSGETLSTEAGYSVALRYINCSGSQLNCLQKCQNVEGFTLRAVMAQVELKNMYSNAEVMAIVAGSFTSGALVALVAALTGKFLLRRYRLAVHVHSSSSSPALQPASHSAIAAVLYGTEEIPMHDNVVYGVALAT